MWCHTERRKTSAAAVTSVKTHVCVQVEMKFLELYFHAFHISSHIVERLAEIPVSYIQGMLFLIYHHICSIKKGTKRDFPGGSVVKNPPAITGDTGSSPGPGRSHMP